MTVAAAQVTIPDDLVSVIEENATAQKELSVLVKQQMGEIKAHQETSTKTAKAIEALETKLNEHVTRALEIGGRLDEIEAKVTRGGVTGGIETGTSQDEFSGKTIGEIFTESEAFKRMHDVKSERSDWCHVPSRVMDQKRHQLTMEVKGFTGRLEIKAPTLGSSLQGGGDLVGQFGTRRLAEIVGTPLAPAMLRNLMRVTRVNDGQIDFMKRTQINRLYTEIDTQAASTQANVVVDNTAGFKVGKTVTLDPDGVAEVATILSITAGAPGTLVMTANLTNTHNVDVPVVSDFYVPTSETVLKPTGRLVYAKVQRPMRTLATWIPVTRQVLRSVPRLRSEIDGELMASLASVEDDNLLNGSGTDPELAGFFAESGIQPLLMSNGQAGDRELHTYRRAITLARLAHYRVDGIVTNDQDWEKTELTRGSDGHFLWVNVVVGGQERVWAVPVQQNTQIAAGTALIGAFQLGAELFERDSAMIRVGEPNDDFLKNQVSVLAEKEVCLAVKRPEAFVKVTFDAYPT